MWAWALIRTNWLSSVSFVQNLELLENVTSYIILTCTHRGLGKGGGLEG